MNNIVIIKKKFKVQLKIKNGAHICKQARNMPELSPWIFNIQELRFSLLPAI